MSEPLLPPGTPPHVDIGTLAHAYPTPPSRSAPLPAVEADPLHEFLRTLRRHIALVVVTTLACGGFAAYRVYSQPPQFRAGASVRLTNMPQEMTAGISGQDPTAPTAIAVDPVLSQIQVLKSRAVAELAVRNDLLRLRPLSRALPFTLLDSVVVAPDAPPDTLSFAFGPTDYTVSSRRGSATRPYGKRFQLGGVQLSVRARPRVNQGDVASLARGLAARHAGQGAGARDRADRDPAADGRGELARPRAAGAPTGAHRRHRPPVHGGRPLPRAAGRQRAGPCLSGDQRRGRPAAIAPSARVRRQAAAGDGLSAGGRASRVERFPQAGAGLQL